VGKSLSQALSPSLSLCLSLGYTVKEEEEEEKKKKKEKGKEKEKEMIFSFLKFCSNIVDYMSYLLINLMFLRCISKQGISSGVLKYKNTPL
jgi:hypothetical protein